MAAIGCLPHAQSCRASPCSSQLCHPSPLPSKPCGHRLNPRPSALTKLGSPADRLCRPGPPSADGASHGHSLSPPFPPGRRLSLGLLTAGTVQAADWCASKPVKFAGVNWESGMLLSELMGFVLQHGYDCTIDSIPGNSITLEQALANDDIQVFAEEWIGRSEAWNKAAAAGKVIGVGAPIELLNRTLAEQAEAKQDAPAAAKALLKAHPELWQAWVTDAGARSKIQAAL